jgi:hypothetical protein
MILNDDNKFSSTKRLKSRCGSLCRVVKPKILLFNFCNEFLSSKLHPISDPGLLFLSSHILLNGIF